MRNYVFARWICLYLCVGILVGCGGNEPPVADQLTEQSTVVADAQTVAPMAPTMAASTATSVPTSTPAPTETPLPTETQVPTETPVPPTNTAVPPTETPVPPTNTAIPPTLTPVPPTNTPLPPTLTPATPTAIPATATVAAPVAVAPVGAQGPTLPRGALTARPWTVMIDNHPAAYPQSGMDKAAVVYEGLAEYGITRFMATYADGVTPIASQVGPIRSTRVYFAQLAMEYRPIYVHAGGSPDGQALVQSTNALINFEADGLPNYAYRDGKRKAPHNLYTSSELLRQFAKDNGVTAFGNDAVGYLYSATATEGTPVGSLGYYFQDRGSSAGWVWSRGDGVYYRTQGGKAHLDRITGAQLWTNNLVVMQVSGGRRAGDDKARIDQDVVGSGAARVFRNGQMTNATWVKDGAAAPLRFYDAGGAEIRFTPGSLWIAGIPSLDRLSAQ